MVRRAWISGRWEYSSRNPSPESSECCHETLEEIGRILIGVQALLVHPQHHDLGFDSFVCFGQPLLISWAILAGGRDARGNKISGKDGATVPVRVFYYDPAYGWIQPSFPVPEITKR